MFLLLFRLFWAGSLSPGAIDTGPNMYTITRKAVRREKSLHNLGCDGSGSHANGCTFGDYESTSSHQPGCDGSGSHKDGCTNGPVPVEYLPYGGVTDGKDSEYEPVNHPQAEAPGSCDRCGSIGPHDTDAPVGHPELAWMASVWICGECSYTHEINIAKVEEPAPQADPQDMTSEEMWESMSSVNQPTITTSWN